MHQQNDGERQRLAIEVEPALRKQIEAAAVALGVSVKDYVALALREALRRHRAPSPNGQSGEWGRLSARSFARDWNSEADAVYDDLA